MDNDGCRRFVAVMTLICALGCPAGISAAASFPLSTHLIGQLQNYKVAANLSLIEIARKFDLGFNEIADANPGIDPWIPPAGTVLEIPTAWILPDLPQPPPKIVINLAELRLYLFPGGRGSVVTFPLGIGDQGRATPVGSYRVIEKTAQPAWQVPKSIRSEFPNLPEKVPPGPNNPLGSHALRLSRNDILIHGTNRPWGIGRRSSHGCLRLYPEDIVKLFHLVATGTRVAIIDQPIKACSLGGKVFVEAHRHKSADSPVGRALHLLADKKLLPRTDFAKLIRAMEEMKGMPVEVTLVP